MNNNNLAYDFAGTNDTSNTNKSSVDSTIINPPTATINVNYYGFEAQNPNDPEEVKKVKEAKNAFEYAATIWEGWIKSDVPIEVDAKWIDLNSYGRDVLGGAVTSSIDFRSNFTGATQDDTSYIMSLANHLAGEDLNGGRAEIEVWLNSGFDNWHLPTDGKPGNKFDFTTVVLHELGHGFGITDRINSNGTGTNGTTIFESFIVELNKDKDGNPKLDPLSNDSSELKTQLRSNNLFFNGANATAANGGEQVKLYAPSKWENGSSIAHLDERTYSKGNPGSLMTPRLNPGEVIHNPGAITLGVLEDLGWDINQVETQNQAQQASEPVETPAPGSIINFQQDKITSYVDQDSSASIVKTIENNQGIELINNGWKKFDFNYQVTKDTILEFEFKSIIKGEIQAIGFETNDKFDANRDQGRIFQLEGKDKFGITDFKQDVTGKGWQTYKINVGDYFNGDIDYLLFTNDHDNGAKNGHSQWKNLRLYEKGQETQTPAESQPPTETQKPTESQSPVEVPSINFQDGEISSYVDQDDSKSVVNTIENNQGIEIIKNGWKKFDFNYQVTKDTILEFEFNSLIKGEIQAIGLETNDKFDANRDQGRIFQLEGKDNFGITDFKQDVTGKGWQTYQIKLSDYFSEDININYLLFANDHDNGSKNAHSQWKNLRVYEKGQETQKPTESQSPVEVPSINFQDGEITSYVDQDDSKSVVNTIDNNQGIEIIKNGWKKFDFNYQVTKDTILEFEFNSIIKGEIQAIGLETNDKFDANSDKQRIFQLEGKDNFGITDFKQDVTGKGWQTYKIKLSDYFSEDININYLLFANDHDNGSKNAHSQWKNLRVYEQNQQTQPEAETQPPAEIPSINFQDGEITSYVDQDDSKSVVNTIDNNQGIEIIKNGWKKFDFNYQVTKDTILEFEFNSIIKGEIQAIGLETDSKFDANSDKGRIFQLEGKDNFGITDFKQDVTGKGWQTYKINVGDYFNGDINYLLFTNDHDNGAKNGHSQFRNLKIYEANANQFSRAANQEVVLTVQDSTNNYNLSSYGGKNQDKGIFNIYDDQTAVELTGNSWKKLDITNYNITENTVLKFEFQSAAEGEIQGIGFDNDDIITDDDGANFFQVSGIQDWGRKIKPELEDDYTIGSEWQTYEVKVGDYDIGGNFNYLTLGNDHDVSNANAHSQFRNISLSEM